MNLGGLPVVLDIFVVAVVLVRLFALADRFADQLGARLHHRRSRGGRISRSSSPRGVSALHPRSYFVACASRRTSVLTAREN